MTHRIISVTPKAASGPGALDGFEFTCSCGEAWGLTSRLETEHAAHDHATYMNAQEEGVARLASRPVTPRRMPKW